MKKIFISYSHKDKEKVNVLVKEMKARGLLPWQDVQSLPLGSLTEPVIRQALANECQGCLLFITPESIKSDFVTKVEMTHALERVRQDNSFAFVPVFHGITIPEAREALKPHLGLRVTNLIGIGIPATLSNDDLRKKFANAAQSLLKAVVLRNVPEFDADVKRKIVIDFFSYKMRPFVPEADLVVDWSDFQKENNTIDTDVCEEILWPALQDAESTLAETIGPRTIFLRPKAIPSCCLAFGFAFRATTGFKLEIQQSKLGKETQIWTVDSSQVVESPLNADIMPDDTSANEGLVEISIYKKSAIALEEAIAASAGNVKQGIRVKASIRPGQDEVDIADSDQANAIAKQVIDTIRHIRGEYPPLRRIHLAFAGPAALAVQIGYRLNAMGPIQLYDKTQRGEEKYVPSFFIG